MAQACVYARRSHRTYHLESHETPIPTVENSAPAPAWLPQSHVHKKRASHPLQPTPRWSQAIDSSLSDADLMTPPNEDHGLPPRSRLRFSSDFRRARETGQRIVLGCLIANWRVLDASDFSRVGVVSSKHIGPAVIRNRARRLLRESFRLNRQKLTRPVDVVLVARKSIADRSYQEVERDFLRALRAARLI